jgi:hypothetical protein
MQKYITWSLIVFGSGILFKVYGILNPSNALTADFICTIAESIAFTILIRKHIAIVAPVKIFDILKTSSLTGLFTGILSGVTNYVNLNYIHPEQINLINENTRLIYQKQNYTEEQITKALELNQDLYTSVFYHLSSSIFSAVFIFGIIALISRWFVQKNKTLA